MVVDEAHNLFNMIVGGSEGGNKIAKLIRNAINTNVLFLTGTPMVNHPYELTACINLLQGKEVIVDDFDVFNRLYFNDVLSFSTDEEKQITMRNIWDL